MRIFENRKTKFLAMKRLRDTLSAQEQPVACPFCKKEWDKERMAGALYICPECGGYLPVPAPLRMEMIADPGSFKETEGELRSGNPLLFPGYEQKLKAAEEKTGLAEGILTGTARIGGFPCMLCVMDSRFFMGSMSSALGEKVTRAVELAAKKKLPLIIFCASGGARMQEGILSLMQMAKTSAAIASFSEKGLLYISVLTHPTTGGVTASFASLGDIILAEPNARIGFAGPRVIEQTIGQKLPEGFQTAEFQQEHGFVDAVVERKELKETLIKLLRLHGRK